MKYVEELETSGWNIAVGDVFSNGIEEFHLKVTQIEIEDEESDPDNAKVYCLPVDPNDHNKAVESLDDAWHRAWYINECWYK
ncbi:hypothetical protein BW897_31935 [Bacillus cereus]|uniref:Uncharacterized protein n=2 Tax=Bacillus cereus group TaxID=86661 RepID=A0A1S9T3C7_BACCE|nr:MULTISPECIES: hypothetical protein [Bacillus cereus group]OOR04523.1 hypothetical protein BW897_31935 [Bacillus cereus]PFT07492.1 hypothetical protein COK59_16125 [Bacillus thuringiensis]PGA19337.1 hypothetical protein COL80_27780 [Bacillus thuringiensis]PGW52243.1 hypothetical protein COE14_22735 [Bacillus thuringiensis]